MNASASRDAHHPTLWVSRLGASDRITFAGACSPTTRCDKPEMSATQRAVGPH